MKKFFFIMVVLMLVQSALPSFSSVENELDFGPRLSQPLNWPQWLTSFATAKEPNSFKSSDEERKPQTLNTSPEPIALSEKQDQKKIKRILVIDGGGIRGIIPAQILTRIEADLSSKDTGFGRNVRIAECFDLIAGTSTGGIIALGLNVPDNTEKPKFLQRPKFSASKLLDIYKGEEGRQIFPYSNFYQRSTNYVVPKHLVDPLENVLRKYFENTKISQSISRVFITSYEILENRPYFFTSYRYVEDYIKKRQLEKNFFMKDVARATSAAPTYFKGAEITDCNGKESCHIDGGVSINNPTVAAILEARRIFPDVTRYVVLSLGTGETPPRDYWKDVKDAGKIQWASQIPDVMMNGAAKLVDHQAEELKKEFKKNNIDIQYIRIQPTLAVDHMDLDNTSPQNLKKLISGADEEYEKKKVRSWTLFVISNRSKK